MKGESTISEVRDALQYLPANEVVLISLAAFEDQTTSQIADLLGISQGAVRTRLHRARAHLANSLNGSHNHLTEFVKKGGD